MIEVKALGQEAVVGVQEEHLEQAALELEMLVAGERVQKVFEMTAVGWAVSFQWVVGA